MPINIIHCREPLWITPNVSLPLALIDPYIIDEHLRWELHRCKVDCLPIVRDTQVEDDRLEDARLGYRLGHM